MKISSKIIAVAIAVVATFWVLSGFFTTADMAEDTPLAESAQNENIATELFDVRVQDFTAIDYADDVVVTGRSQASRKVILRAETSGQVQDILMEEGDAVEAQQVLARLELRDRAERLTEAKKRLSQRQIEYSAAKRLEDKGFNSKTRLAEALADLEDARTVLKQIEVDISKVEMKAPFDGIISDQFVEEGDYLSVGDDVFSVVDMDPIEFAGFISERRIQEIKPGSEANVRFLDGGNIKAKVTFIAPTADAQTRTFRVVVQSENKDSQIKEGLTVKLHIPVDKKKAHKISPSILSLNDEGQMGVKVVNDQNVVEFVPVKILADKPDGMYITGPPSPSRFITVGQDFVKEGQKVNPVESDAGGLL